MAFSGDLKHVLCFPNGLVGESPTNPRVGHSHFTEILKSEHNGDFSRQLLHHTLI